MGWHLKYNNQRPDPKFIKRDYGYHNACWSHRQLTRVKQIMGKPEFIGVASPSVAPLRYAKITDVKKCYRAKPCP